MRRETDAAQYTHPPNKLQVCEFYIKHNLTLGRA